MRKFSKVAVIKGGPSSEREISLVSGAAVAGGLRDAGYEVEEVDPKDGRLVLPDGVEACFIALHGEFGEDGEIQGMLEIMGMPYTGSGPGSSRRAFDKYLTKRVLKENGISTAEYVLVGDEDAAVPELPVVVKPAWQGSSIGIHRVFTEDEWLPAIKDALSYGGPVISERFVEGREVTVGIIDGEVLPIVEITVDAGWYSYDSKYTKGKTTYSVPADLAEPVAEKCRDLALQTFDALGCYGFGRVDLIVPEDGEPCVLELNSIPGFTETSLLPKAAAAAGVGFSELCSRIMEMASTGHS